MNDAIKTIVSIDQHPIFGEMPSNDAFANYRVIDIKYMATYSDGSTGEITGDDARTCVLKWQEARRG